MRSLLLVACLTGFSLADERPSVRITHPVDGVELPPDTDIKLSGIVDHRDVDDLSKFQVQLRLYQGVVNRLKLVDEAAAELVKVEGETGLYRFRSKLHQPGGAADGILRVEVYETKTEGPKWVARDFITVSARSKAPALREATDEPLRPAIARDRRVLMGNDLDGVQYDVGAQMAPTGFLTLNGASNPASLEGRYQFYRVVGGRLKVYEEGRSQLRPAEDGMQFDVKSIPRMARPAGDYILRFDIVDPKKPEHSLIRDATMLKMVPRKEPKPAPQS